ncbi:hypothetical protein BKA70DRAFT_1370860 [Coprinopsis sp. MPI-PUGE-AT-0042]|nr:hypothetical protein BKA70DRAFT_1370860 [Coprinopsis sp. MPI-PUGE-AT-0042]
MSEPYYGPDAPQAEILIERFFVAGDFYLRSGIWYVLPPFFQIASKRSARGKRTSTILLLYMCLMLAVSTLYAAVQAHTVQDVYVDNRNYPGGPWTYFLNSQTKAHNVMFYATLFLLTCGRCWVIWRASGDMLAYFVVGFPAMIIIGSFVMGTLWTIWSSSPGLSLYSDLPRKFGTAYYSLSLGVNILLTILIASLLPGEDAREYYSLAAIFVESAALYSVMAILFIVTYAIDHPINQIWLCVASNSQQIATYWIIYRVARGKAWTKETLAQTGSKYTVPHMNFAPPTDSMIAGKSTVMNKKRATPDLGSNM